VRCSVLQCVAVCCSAFEKGLFTCNESSVGTYTETKAKQRDAVCCSVLQCVAVCCSVL